MNNWERVRYVFQYLLRRFFQRAGNRPPQIASQEDAYHPDSESDEEVSDYEGADIGRHDTFGLPPLCASGSPARGPVVVPPRRNRFMRRQLWRLYRDPFVISVAVFILIVLALVWIYFLFFDASDATNTAPRQRVRRNGAYMMTFGFFITPEVVWAYSMLVALLIFFSAATASRWDE